MPRRVSPDPKRLLCPLCSEPAATLLEGRCPICTAKANALAGDWTLKTVFTRTVKRMGDGTSLTLEISLDPERSAWLVRNTTSVSPFAARFTLPEALAVAEKTFTDWVDSQSDA